MAGLACGEPSLLAWQELERSAAAFMAIPDVAAVDCMRLLAAEGMVWLGTLSLDGTKLAGNAAYKANRALPQIGKVLAEAAGADAAEDARQGGNPQPSDAAGAGPPDRTAGAAGQGPGPACRRGTGPPRRGSAATRRAATTRTGRRRSTP